MVVDWIEVTDCKVQGLLRAHRLRTREAGREHQRSAGDNSMQHVISPKLTTLSLGGSTAGVMPLPLTFDLGPLTSFESLCPLNHLEHRVMNASVGSDKVCGRGVESCAVHPGHAPTGLLDDERACSHIPGLEALLPEPVEAAS